MEDSCVFVIVGGGIAGVSCAQTLALTNTSDKIMLITPSETVKVTNNVLQLTKTLTQFDVVEQQADQLTIQYPNITVLRDTCVSIDPCERLLRTVNNKVIGYKKLCLCTGGKPKLFQVNNPYVIGVRDVDSVSELSRRLSSARCVVIVGNGGIATELIYEVKHVKKIWVVKDDHISSAFVDKGASQFFQNCLLKNSNSEPDSDQCKRMRYTVSNGEGVVSGNSGGPALGPDWHTGLKLESNQQDTSDDVVIEYGCYVTNVVSLEQEEYPVRVVLSNDKCYDCDFIISATGVEPNISNLTIVRERLELADDGGISVDWKLETNIENIFAAGDVCSAGWDLAQHWHQMRLWTQARQMGIYAAQSMSASLSGQVLLQDFCFEMFSHVTRFFGFKVVLLGLFNGQKLNGEYEILLRVTKNVEYVKLIIKNGKLQGALLIGETDLEEMCENLILDQIDVSPYGEDLLNPDIDIEDYFD